MNMDKEKMQVQEKEELEIDLVEMFYYFRTKIAVILAAFFIGAVAAGIITYFFITPEYQATSKLYMVSASGDSVVDLTDLNLGTSLSLDYEELLRIRPIFEEIIKEEKLPYSYNELLGMVDISAVDDTRILTVTVTSTDPAEAQKVANALAEKAVTYVPELMEVSAPNIAEHAIYPEGKSSPSLSRNIMLGAILCTALVMAVLVILFMMDDTLQSAEDVEKVFGIMPMTVIPEGDMKEISDEAEHRGRRKRWRFFRGKRKGENRQ